MIPESASMILFPNESYCWIKTKYRLPTTGEPIGDCPVITVLSGATDPGLTENTNGLSTMSWIWFDTLLSLRIFKLKVPANVQLMAIS